MKKTNCRPNSVKFTRYPWKNNNLQPISPLHNYLQTIFWWYRILVQKWVLKSPFYHCCCLFINSFSFEITFQTAQPYPVDILRWRSTSIHNECPLDILNRSHVKLLWMFMLYTASVHIVSQRSFKIRGDPHKHFFWTAVDLHLIYNEHSPVEVICNIVTSAFDPFGILFIHCVAKVWLNCDEMLS